MPLDTLFILRLQFESIWVATEAWFDWEQSRIKLLASRHNFKLIGYHIQFTAWAAASASAHLTLAGSVRSLCFALKAMDAIKNESRTQTQSKVIIRQAKRKRARERKSLCEWALKAHTSWARCESTFCTQTRHVRVTERESKESES